MKREQVKGNTTYTFDSIVEFANYVRNGKTTHAYDTYYKTPQMALTQNDRATTFSQTKSYDEAEDLLLHGWDSMANTLNKRLQTSKVNTGVKYKNKPQYGVQGYQACVPRYLQGMPDSMISTKRIVTKQKVVNIVKSVAYPCTVSANRIKEESLKVFKSILNLENEGYRVNLSVICSLSDVRGKKVSFMIKVKSSGQKMNLKQLAFPLVHPSMLRRVILRAIEITPECETMGKGHGLPLQDKSCLKDCYYFPSVIDEQEITDISKYRVD